MAHAGIRLGRKTYVVNMSTGDRRTACVAVSNTAVGVSLLVAGAVLAAGSALDPIWPLLGLSLLNLGGAGMALTLNEVQP